MNTKVFRIIGGPSTNPPSTDIQDIEGVTIVIATSGAYTNGNVVQQGGPICYDVTSLVTNNTTTPVSEQGCLPVNSTSAGAVMGVYQGNTITNSSTSAVLTTTITVRKWGYGLVLAGGVTTSVTVGGTLTILPGSTPAYASQLAASANALQQSAVYYVGSTVATGAKTTVGAVVISASTTTQGLVNAYIAVAS